MKAHTLTVSKSAGRLKGEVQVTQPKTANSVRTICLPQGTVDLLVKEHEKHPSNPYMFPLRRYSAGFTLDPYAHVTGDMRREAADQMGWFIAQAI